MTKIHDSTLSTILVKNFTMFAFKSYYSEYIVIGKENIPADCPVIFAANHTNALMDALAVHSIAPKGKQVVFLARADLFRKKYFAKILHFLKIMPAFRMRDGLENLGKNAEIFQQCVNVLHQNGALGIMPEGNQEVKRSLRPLAKGIFRIAFAAQQKWGLHPSVKIIPVGLDYGDRIKANKPLIIAIGKPIELSDYMEEFGINSVAATNKIRDCLRTNLSQISLDLSTDKYYDSFETATEICTLAFLNQLNLTDTTINRYIARGRIANRLVELEIAEPDKIEKLNLFCRDYTDQLHQLNLRDWVFEQKNGAKFHFFSEAMYLFSTFSLFGIGALLNFFPFFIPVFLRKYILKTQFTGFYSSLQFGLAIFTFPIFYAIETAIFAAFTDCSWWVSLIFLLVLFPLGKWALKWNSTFKKFSAKCRYNRYIASKPERIESIIHLRSKITELILP